MSPAIAMRDAAPALAASSGWGAQRRDATLILWPGDPIKPERQAARLQQEEARCHQPIRSRRVASKFAEMLLQMYRFHINTPRWHSNGRMIEPH